MSRLELGWNDLNESAKQKVAELYGYATPEEFEANENSELYPLFEVYVEDDDEDDDDEEDE